jgi:hypothetical protein
MQTRQLRLGFASSGTEFCFKIRHQSPPLILANFQYCPFRQQRQPAAAGTCSSDDVSSEASKVPILFYVIFLKG